MRAPDILGRLQNLGLYLSAEGETLRAEPKAAITDEARALIRQHKLQLLALLKASPAITSRGWTVTYPNGSTVEVFILLADGSCPNRAEVLRDFVGACDATPIPEGEQ